MSSNVETQAHVLRERLDEQFNEYESKLVEIREKLKQTQAKLKEKDMQTDKSENSDYGDIIAQIKSYEAMANQYTKRRDAFIAYDVSGTYVPTGIIKEGTTVELTHKQSGTKWCLLLVPNDLGNASDGYLSTESAVGLAIMGHKANEEVIVQTLHGTQYYTIGEIY